MSVVPNPGETLTEAIGGRTAVCDVVAAVVGTLLRIGSDDEEILVAAAAIAGTDTTTEVVAG